MDERHVVRRSDGKLACKGWRGAPGSGFIWSHAAPWADWVLVFPTEHGATLFSQMNGGHPISMVELTKAAA
jgi:hypothetical protein